jgi:hypothetical protein
VFSRAVDERRDVSETFWADYGGTHERIVRMRDTEVALREKIREVLKADPEENCFLFDLNELAGRRAVQARDMLQCGLVAAVDGTDAMAPISHMSTSTYVVAVEMVTRLTRTKPEIWLTEASTQYLRPEEVTAPKFDLLQLCEELDQARNDGSWMTSFREYAERDFAIRSGLPLTILDGPILTQNLLTQQRGRELYARLFAEPGRTWVGVIKDVSATATLMKWCAYSLNRGEGCVISTSQDMLRTRFDPARYGARAPRWLEAVPSDIVRVAYRPGEKAFGFECRRADLELVMAVLMEDASPTLHHELPLLLEIVDAHLRGGFRASAIRAAVVGRLMQHNWQMGIDAMDERDLR